VSGSKRCQEPFPGAEEKRFLTPFFIRKYNDGYVQKEPGRAGELGYPEPWLRKVLRQRPDQFYLQPKPEDVPESELVD